MRKLTLFLSLLILATHPINAAKPGGVNGSKLWLRADRGTSNSLWEDQSGSGNDASQSNSTYQPTHGDNVANFNPAFYFTDHFFDVDYTSNLNGADLSVFTVVMSDGSSGWRSPWTTRDNPLGTTTSGHILYLRSDNNKYDYWNGSLGGWKTLDTHTLPSHNFEIVTTTSDSAGFSKIDKAVYIQGKSVVTASNVDFLPNTSKPFRIGKGATEKNNGSYPWHGYIAETIVFDKTVDDSERNRVESYLAIKYGMTLDQSGGGEDYHDSNGGSAIWSVSNNSGYGHDIAGLGRDTGSNGSDLDQRVSHSINSDAVVVMSTNTDFSSENSDSSRPQLSGNNRRFLIWSNNNGGHVWTDTGAPAGGKILERKWKVQKAGNNQRNVNIEIDTNDVDFDIDPFEGNLFFVKGTDLSTATPMKMINDGGSKWHIEDINFDDGDLFSFVYLPTIHNQAEMVINEVMFYQKTNHSLDNEEFVEFYVTTAGTLKQMLISDQENHQYTFPDYTVQAGDYVVLYMGGGTESHNGGVHKYYRNRTQTPLNNNNDDVVLLKQSNTYTTELDGETVPYVPVDYVAYKRTNGGSNHIQGIPTTTQNPTIAWSGGPIDASGISRLQSVSLTANGNDTDSASHWEKTTSGDAAPEPLTIDSNTGSVSGTAFVCSDGHNNNALPDMSITKSSCVINDPVNSTAHPKRIPGATIRYAIEVKNSGMGLADNVIAKDTVSAHFDTSTITNLKIDGSHACNCLNPTSPGANGSNGTGNSANPVKLDFGSVSSGATECGYFEVKIK